MPASAQAGPITPRGPASVAVYVSESTSTMTLAVPSGTQPGDVLVASLGFGSTVATAQPALSGPSGWTLVTRVDQDVVGSLAVYWHVFAAGETSYSWTAGVKVGGAAFLTAYGGVDATNPIDSYNGQVTIKSVAIVAPSITTSLPGDALVASYFGYRGNGGAVTWSPPSGMTELGDAGNARSRSGCVDYAVQVTAGPSGSKTATASGRQDYGIAVLTGLRPAPAPPDTTPPVISGVAAGSISASVATVTWSTDEVSDSQVDSGTSSSYGSSTTLDPTLVLNHSVTLSGLAASTSYHYRVKSRDAAGNLATSGDLTFTTTAVADTTPPVISGLAAGSISASGATATWSTDEASDSQVDYGTSTSYGSSTTLDPTLVLNHSVTLSGLAASTPYHYRVKSRDASGNLATSTDFTFTTSAAPDTTPPVISGVAAGSISSTGAAISWTTDEPADSQVDYGISSSYGSSSSLNTPMVLVHSVSLSGLTAGTTYHYRVKSRDAAGNLATSADFTFTTNASEGGPVPIIVDTDMFSDADDVGALATAFGLQIKGEATVIAIGVNTRTSRPAVATNSWKCAAAIAQFYDSASVPIGSDMPDDGTATNTPDFVGPCSQLASPSTPAPDTAVNVFRRALAGQPNGSVVVVAVGYEENLSNLLHSASDSISPLAGQDLVALKVKTLVIMGGRYPSGTGETNFAGNVAAAQDIAANWPTKVVYSGTEVGDAVHTGDTISGVHPANSPVRVAYEAFVGANNWIYSYDLTAVYHAVRPADTLLTEAGPGTNTINSRGGNVFTTGAGNDYYLSLTNASSLDASIEALLDTLPSNPPDTTPPVIGGVGAGSVSASGAQVSWSTDEASDSRVEYGLTSSYGSTISINSLVTSHSVALAGLSASTVYHYRVSSRDAAGNVATSGDFTFATTSLPPPGLNETFDSNTIDPAKWTVVQSGSTVAATDQELQISHPGSTSWTKGSIQSVTPYDITGRCTSVQVRRAANDGLGGVTYGETSVFLSVDATHYVFFFVAGGALTAWVNGGSGEVNLTPSWPRYSAANMQWLRFRESGGTLYWEYASGATAPGTWTILASMPDPFPMGSVSFNITAGSNAAMTDTSRFDNISTC